MRWTEIFWLKLKCECFYVSVCVYVCMDGNGDNLPTFLQNNIFRWLDLLLLLFFIVQLRHGNNFFIHLVRDINNNNEEKKNVTTNILDSFMTKYYRRQSSLAVLALSQCSDLIQFVPVPAKLNISRIRSKFDVFRTVCVLVSAFAFSYTIDWLRKLLRKSCARVLNAVNSFSASSRHSIWFFFCSIRCAGDVVAARRLMYSIETISRELFTKRILV